MDCLFTERTLSRIMIVNCRRDGLLNALQIVSAALPSRTTMPIYMNVKAIATADGLTLMGTDLEVGIRYELRGVNMEQPGEAILPTGRLMSILRESAGPEVSLEADPRRTRVHTQNGEFEMPGEDPAAFADVAEFSDQNYYEMSAGDLQRMIRRTGFAAAREEGKYAMRGVLWDLEDKKSRLVATDGKRLALTFGGCIVQGKIDAKGQSHLVPPKAMTLLDRILSDGDAGQAVQVNLRPNDAIFRTEKSVITSRLVEGRFPPYRDVIPKKANIKVPIAVGQFLSAVRQAAIMTDDESKRVSFAFTSGKVTLQAQGPDVGKSKVTLPIEDFSGPDITIEFDPSYLIDLLKILEPEMQIRLDMIDPAKSAVFHVGDDYLYMVVPMS